MEDFLPIPSTQTNDFAGEKSSVKIKSLAKKPIFSNKR